MNSLEIKLNLIITCAMVTCNVVFTKWTGFTNDELTYVDNPVESAFPGHLPVSIVKRIMEMRVRTTTGLYQTLKRLSKEIRQPLTLKRNTTIKNVLLYGTTISSIHNKPLINLKNEIGSHDRTQTAVPAIDFSTSSRHYSATPVKTSNLTNIIDLFFTITSTEVTTTSLCTSTIITSENSNSVVMETELSPETMRTITEKIVEQTTSTTEISSTTAKKPTTVTKTSTELTTTEMTYLETGPTTTQLVLTTVEPTTIEVALTTTEKTTAEDALTTTELTTTKVAQMTTERTTTGSTSTSTLELVTTIQTTTPSTTTTIETGNPFY